jgi:hypothetical protein
MGLDAHWDAAYADGDEDRSWTQEQPTESLEAVASVSPALDAPLIDVGGGSSRLSAALLDAGHTDITVLDLSSRAGLDLARRRLGAWSGHGQLARRRPADLAAPPRASTPSGTTAPSCTSSQTRATGHAASTRSDPP